MAAHKVWLASVAVAVATVFAAAAGTGAQQPRDGEQILNASCSTGCHDSRPIQTSAKSEAEWSETIATMADRGATISDQDKAILVPYLARIYGPIPEGRGKDVVLNVCTMCHDLTRIKRSRHTMEEWEDVLSTMLNEGAPLSDADFPIVLNYLTKSFGVE